MEALNAFTVCVVLGLCQEAKAEDICWSTYGNFQYKVLTGVGGAPFSEAIAACEHENTTLTSVLSLEEDMFLQTFAMSQLGVPVWIGLHRKDENMTWIDGSEVNYINSNYRRKSYEESCVYMFQGWIEAHCHDAELYFICKRELKDAGTCVETSSTMTVTTNTPTETTTHDITTDAFSRFSTLSIVRETTGHATVEAQVTTTSFTEETTVVTTVDDVDESPPDSLTDDSDDVTTVTDEPDDGITIEPPATEQTDSTTVSTLSIPLVDDQAEHYSNEAVVATTEAERLISETSLASSEDPPMSTRDTNTGGPSGEVTTASWEQTFEGLLHEMRVKKKPVYSTTEAENSAAIGSVSILILLGIVFGIVLLDITTIRSHWKLFQYNTKGLCSNCRKAKKQERSDVLELVDIIEH